MLYHLLHTQTISLLSPLPTDEQILLMQTEHLQITASINFLHVHIERTKATGKHPAHITEIPFPAEKIGIGLWEFPKGKAPGMFNIFRKQMIIAGRIHIWNIKSKIYETEMEQMREKRFYKMYCGNEETYYSADGVEFFTFTSLFH